LHEWRGVARLQKAILEATALKLGELEFEDALELGLHLLERCLIAPAVPARVVAAGLRAIAVASGHEERLRERVNPRVPKANGGRGLVRMSFSEESTLRLQAFVAEVEGRSLRPEEVPDQAGHSMTIAVVEALRRDDVEAASKCASQPRDLEGYRGFSVRTLVDLGINIAPKLTGNLSYGVLAVEFNARKCALARRGDSSGNAINHALANGADEQFLTQLMERYEFTLRGRAGVRATEELKGIAFMRAHGVFPLVSRHPGWEAEAWDAGLALVLYEEGTREPLIRVGEPTSGRAFFALVRSAAPAARRRLLRSRKQAEGVCELIECIQREPQSVLQWLVKNSVRGLPWPELGAALHRREIGGRTKEGRVEIVDQMPFVDVAKAETVVELLGFPECVLDMVVLALLDVGCDARAAVLIAKYHRDSKRNWVKMAVRALLGPGEEALAQLCGRLNDGVGVGWVAKERANVLTQMGRDGAAVLEFEFQFLLASRNSRTSTRPLHHRKASRVRCPQ
jgi:hypothetical protein